MHYLPSVFTLLSLRVPLSVGQTDLLCLMTEFEEYLESLEYDLVNEGHAEPEDIPVSICSPTQSTYITLANLVSGSDD